MSGLKLTGNFGTEGPPLYREATGGKNGEKREYLKPLFEVAPLEIEYLAPSPSSLFLLSLTPPLLFLCEEAYESALSNVSCHHLSVFLVSLS